MKKISKLIRAAKGLMRYPRLINSISDHNLLWKDYVEKHYGAGFQLKITDLKELIPVKQVEVPLVSFLGGSSLPTDFLLLMGLAGSFDRCSYFEIGTWRGESVSNVANVAERCFTLNLPIDTLKQRGFTDHYINQIGIFLAEKPNITQLWGNSFDFDFAGLNQKFDLIFIDGDHHYDAVLNDTRKVFDHLVHDRTVVVWHDYALNPEEIRYEVLAGILDALPPDQHRYLYHVAHTLSAIFFRDGLPVSEFRYYSNPRYTFRVTLEQRKFPENAVK